MVTLAEMQIQSLGECRIPSPLVERLAGGDEALPYVSDAQRLLYDDLVSCPDEKALCEAPSFELAGPREKLFFDPSKTRAGIVTCGGLCPGLNDVIRSIVLGLWYNYGVQHIYGFQNGYQGFVANYQREVIDLNPDVVDGWQELGGTQLGSSRGEQAPAEIVDCLERMSINILFVIGGDGTMRGAQAIAAEIKRRNLRIAVVGAPKTIDNDIMYIDESFGFQTAYSAASAPISCAHVEAQGAPNGVGLVKVMGRDSGFLACYAALAMSDVNFVLIPEVPFELDAFLQALRRRLMRKEHAVIVVAEGAGQNLMDGETVRDASGNTIHKDIGLFLKDKIKAYFSSIGMTCSLKYIDPSYIIRSVPANAADSVYCLQLGHDAVHAAMAGKTGMMVGRWHGRLVHVPMELATRARKLVDPADTLWHSVLETTGMMTWFDAGTEGF